MSKKSNRKTPMTINLVAGMLESSAMLDTHAAKQGKIEAKTVGKPMGWHQGPDGIVREVIDVSAGYSLGIMQSAQVLAGLAAELVLKYAFESENPKLVAPSSHHLHDLYCRLSQKKRTSVESDYAKRIKRHTDTPPVGWRKAKQVFQSADNYFVDWRYLSEEGNNLSDAQPIFLREAVCSVIAALGVTVNWGESK